MLKFYKYSITALLVIGLGFILWVSGKALFGSNANQTQNEQQKEAARPVLGKLISLNPRPARPKAGFLDINGNQKQLSDFEGKVILLNIWATWCEPCVKEMPSLDQLQAKLGKEAFEVVAISADRSVDEAKDFYVNNNITHMKFYQDTKLAVVRELYVKNYPSGLPISVLYNAKGQEVARLSGGYDWVSEPAIRRIEQEISASGLSK